MTRDRFIDGANAPDDLRAAITADLSPVAPLPAPSARLLWIVPVALLLLFLASSVFSVRGDAVRLGWVLSWGASSLEMVVGLGVIGAALREAVPGTMVSRRALGVIACAALATVTMITYATWNASPQPLLQKGLGFVWRVCLFGTIASAMPALAMSLILVRRAYPLRPALAGALCGLGSGLLADAGWRMFCHFSDPRHVFGAHALGVAAVMLIGLALSRRSR